MSLEWSDERYVRLYTRDTSSWLLGPWEARAVLGPVLRKVDRAGTISLGDEGLEALAVVVLMPIEVVRVGMAWWLKRGTFELAGGTLVAVNFIEAQEAIASNAQRSREKRERARDRARAKGSDEGLDDTKRVAPDTKRVATDTSTPSADTPNRTVPSSPVGAGPAVPPEPNQEPAAAPLGDLGDSPSWAVRQVFDHWAERQAKLTGAPLARLKLSEDRKRKIRARLAEKYSVEDLKKAIDGMFATPFNVEGGHTDVELACRDAAHVDRYMQGGKGSHKNGFQETPPEGRAWESGLDDEPQGAA